MVGYSVRMVAPIYLYSAVGSALGWPIATSELPAAPAVATVPAAAPSDVPSPAAFLAPPKANLPPLVALAPAAGADAAVAELVSPTLVELDGKDKSGTDPSSLSFLPAG